MLVIEVSQIPPEGMVVETPLDPAKLHLEREGSFDLQLGAHLACRLERGEGASVHVQGRLRAPVGQPCGRCLEPSRFSLDQVLDVFFLPRIVDATVEDGEEDDVELSDHDLVVAYYEDGRFDLGELAREQIVLALPMKPLCREDCRGLCAQCGVNLNESTCGCLPLVDPRLQALARLLEPGS